ncbi:hypothetical protein M3J09_004419 [Ascochyta lentis]
MAKHHVLPSSHFCKPQSPITLMPVSPFLLSVQQRAEHIPEKPYTFTQTSQNTLELPIWRVITDKNAPRPTKSVEPRACYTNYRSRYTRSANRLYALTTPSFTKDEDVNVRMLRPPTTAAFSRLSREMSSTRRKCLISMDSKGYEALTTQSPYPYHHSDPPLRTLAPLTFHPVNRNQRVGQTRPPSLLCCLVTPSVNIRLHDSSKQNAAWASYMEGHLNASGVMGNKSPVVTEVGKQTHSDQSSLTAIAYLNEIPR